MRRLLILLLVLTSLLNLVSCKPQSEPSSPFLQIPTPGLDTGVVTGRLVSKTESSPPNANLFLSKNVTEGQTEVPPVFSFSYETNPRGVVDENSFFYFADVPEGTYVLTLWTPPGQANFIKLPSEEDYVWVRVKANEKIELGEIELP